MENDDENSGRKGSKRRSSKVAKLLRPQRRRIDTTIAQVEKTPSGILKKTPEGAKGAPNPPETRMVPSLPQLENLNPQIMMKYTNNETERSSVESNENISPGATSSEGSKQEVEVKYSSSKTSNSTKSEVDNVNINNDTDRESDHGIDHESDHGIDQESDHQIDHGIEHESYHETDQESDHETDHQSDHETDHESNYESNYESNHESNHESNYESNHESNYELNHELNHETDQETYRETDHETDYETDHETYHEMHHDTDYEINHEADYETNYETDDNEAPYDVDDIDYEGEDGQVHMEVEPPFTIDETGLEIEQTPLPVMGPQNLPFEHVESRPEGNLFPDGQEEWFSEDLTYDPSEEVSENQSEHDSRHQ